MKISTIETISNEQLLNLRDNIDSIIPSGQTTLIEKFQILIEYNQYLLQNIASQSTLKEYSQTIATSEIKLDISKTDISRIKKYITQFNYTKNIQDKFILDSDGIIQIDKKLTLKAVHNFYSKKINEDFSDKKSLKELNEVLINDSDIDSFSSIKIYDFYKNSKDKEEFFNDIVIQNVLFHIKDKIGKLEIISTIDSFYMNDVLSELYKYDQNNKKIVTIKHISNPENSYIPSVFFILVKCRIKESNNYKEYLFYLEEEINFGSVGYITNKFSSIPFYELLEKRFDTQFYDPSNIEFHPKDEKDIFENSVNAIVTDIKNLLYSLSDTTEKDIQDLRKKIILLKLHYPKMNYNYKLLGRLAKYVVSVNKILRETKNGKALDNSTYLIKQILEKQINPSINELFRQIQMEQLVMKKKIDVKKLRMSVYINFLADSNKTLCDVFDDLNWSSTNDILLSLDTIANSIALLKKIFSIFNIDNLPFNTMQNLFKERIMEQILNGELISFGGKSMISI